jgi:hypothetical protein
MANEMKIDQEQFEQLTDWLEGLRDAIESVVSHQSQTNERLDELIKAVNGVESAVSSS